MEPIGRPAGRFNRSLQRVLDKNGLTQKLGQQWAYPRLIHSRRVQRFSGVTALGSTDLVGIEFQSIVWINSMKKKFLNAEVGGMTKIIFENH